MTNGVITWTYTYDANGMRTFRSNGTDTYTYVYNGDKLVQMTKGSETLYFSYDANGTPLSFTYEGSTFYYVTNLQGDVVAILNANGMAIASYYYDAWGNDIDNRHGGLGQLNPLRYRGYVYDTETGLYYLQSRYYNPKVGRFLNADAFTTTGQGLLGNNMFAYCLNNPVNYMDPTGHDSILSRIIEWIWTGIKAVLLMCRIMDVKNSGNAIVHQSGEMDVCTDGLLHVPCMDKEGNSLNPYGDTSHQCQTAVFLDTVYSDSVNYMVVPGSYPGLKDLERCVGVIINNYTGEYVYAVVGEVGPEENSSYCGASAWDEVSIHAAWIINGHETGAPIANTRQYGSYTFIIFLNSQQSWDTSGDLQSQIDAIGKQYWP